MSLKFTGEIIGNTPDLYAVFNTTNWLGVIKKNEAGKPQETICSERVCRHLVETASPADAAQLNEAISRLSTLNRRGDVNESTETLFAQLGISY